jgi:hypothetical protein
MTRRSGLYLLLSFLTLSSAVFAAQPWDQPFASSPAEISKAAAALKMPEKSAASIWIVAAPILC